MHNTIMRRSTDAHIFNIPGIGDLKLTVFYQRNNDSVDRPFYAADEIVAQIEPSVKTAMYCFIRSHACKAPIAAAEDIPITDKRQSLPEEVMNQYICYDQLDRYYMCPMIASVFIYYIREEIMRSLLSVPARLVRA